MGSEVHVRPARPADARDMARVHVRSWRETYRGTLMPDAVLDDPELLLGRERFWEGALTDERWAANRVAVAEQDGSIVGIAMSGPVDDEAWTQQLYVLYVLAEHHGSGAGAALLAAVLDADEPAALWVAHPNPRAQAFYRRTGFVEDGTARTEDGVRSVRMIRAADETSRQHR